MDIYQIAKNIQDKLVAHRRFLHEHPELESDLPITTEYVMNALSEMGYKPKEIVNSGVLATLTGKRPGKTVLLRADMDALPFRDGQAKPKEGDPICSHTCGHDINTTMLLGAAEILKQFEDEIEGTIKFMFQPNEERLQGAKAMIEAGILESPKVDYAMSIHLWTKLSCGGGVLVIPPKGAILSGTRVFEIDIKGKGAFGAFPENSIDANYIMANILLNLQSLNSREVAGNERFTLTIGSVHGGEAPVGIAETCKMQGFIKTFNLDIHNYVMKRVREIAKQTAEMYRGEAEVKILAEAPPLMNDEELRKEAREAFVETFSKEKVVEFLDVFDGPLLPSDDASFVAEKVPLVHILLTADKESEDGNVYMLHHPKVEFDAKVLPKGAAAFTSFALKILKKK